MKVKIILLMFLMSILLTTANTMAASSQESILDTITNQSFSDSDNVINIQVNSDGTLTTGDSTNIPMLYSKAKRFGMFTSKVIESKDYFQSVIINVGKKVVSPSDIIMIEARGSFDNVKWTEWQVLKDTSTDEIKFYDVLKYLQYKITIISNDINAPVLDKVDLKVRKVSKEEKTAFKQKKPFDGNKLFVPSLKGKSNTYTAKATGKTSKTTLRTSSTYTITTFTPYSTTCYATREGLVGGTTANGHIITSTDVFVALPSNTSLCSLGEYTYTVDLSYNGVTMTNVPVWDIGPHNQYDDYWNVNYNTLPYPPYQYRIRNNWGYESYGDLSRGFSEAYSAYVNSFHSGWSSSHPLASGTITAYQSDSQPGSQYHATKSNSATNPNHLTKAEIDFSESVWNTLGLSDNSFVTVTFNWVSE